MAKARWDRSRRLQRDVALTVGTLTLALLVAGALLARPPAAPPSAPPPSMLPGTLPAAPPAPAGNEAFVPRAALEPPPESTTGPYPMPPELIGMDLNKQSPADVAAKSSICQTCHANSHDPHYKDSVHIGCTDCHGGRSDISPDAMEKCKPGAPESARLLPGRSAVAEPGRLARRLGESGPFVHAAQPRIAGVHPLRQSRRLAD